MMQQGAETFVRETFAVGELMQLMVDPVYRGVGIPRGDGRTVLVLPGLFANDVYLHPLRKWLRRIGYRPVRSTLAMNVGCPQRLTLQIEEELARHRGRNAGPVALIGHSRGGILARAMAARLGEDASHLILLGSPLGAIARMPEWQQAVTDPPAARQVTEASNAARRFVDPDCDVPYCGCPYPQDLRRPLNRATRVVAVYSSDDPIVPAAACPVEGARNVEVRGTHSGLAFNRRAYRAIGEALAE